MKSTANFTSIYLHRENVDMRKSINGLSQIVSEALKLNPCGESLFVFVSRDRGTIKMLYWDKSGFALWHKRLEKEKFHWLKYSKEQAVPISYEQLDLLLAGIDIERSKPHEILRFEAFS